MSLEIVLQDNGFSLSWENSADFLHLVFSHPQLQEKAWGISLDQQQRSDLLDTVRHALRLQLPPPQEKIYLGSLPAVVCAGRLLISLGPGANLHLEALQADRVIVQVDLNSRSTLRALIHMLTQDSAEPSRVIAGPLIQHRDGRLQVGSQVGDWEMLFSHVLDPAGSRLPLNDVPPLQFVSGYLNTAGVWERLSLSDRPKSAPVHILDRGCYVQVEAAWQAGDNAAATALERAYLYVHKRQLGEASRHIQIARLGFESLSQSKQDLIIELETYLLCQQGANQLGQINKNMSQLLKHIPATEWWVSRRLLSNWRVFLNLIFDDQVPAEALQPWSDHLFESGIILSVYSLSFVYTADQSRPVPKVMRSKPQYATRTAEYNLLLPLLAIVMAVLVGVGWRLTHPLQWEPKVTTVSSTPGPLLR